MEQVHQGLEPVNFLPYIDEKQEPLNDEEYMQGIQDEQEGYQDGYQDEAEEMPQDNISPDNP